MKKYLKIYKLLLKLNFSNLTSYRANFVNSFISSLMWGTFSIASIALLTSRSSSVFGWKREEILLLSGSYAILIGIFHMFFSRNFDRLSDIIHFGELDTILVKPIDSQFAVSFYWINYTSIFRIVFGVIFNLYLIKNFNLSFTILNLISFLILTIMGIVVLYSLWFIVSTLLIWFTRLSNLIDLMFSISSVSRFPGEMIRELKFYVFIFFIPLTLIVTVPTKFLIQKGSLLELLSLLLFSIIFFYLSRKFWKFALRYYTSVG